MWSCLHVQVKNKNKLWILPLSILSHQTPVVERICVCQQGDITSLCRCRTAGWRFRSVTSSAGSGVLLMRCFIWSLLVSLRADRMMSPFCFILHEGGLDASLAHAECWLDIWTVVTTRCHRKYELSQNAQNAHTQFLKVTSSLQLCG